MNRLDTTLYNYSIDSIRGKFRNINTDLVRKFSLLFKKDEQGKSREWKDIEEGQIRDLWSKSKATMNEVINDFKYIRIPKNPIQDALNQYGKFSSKVMRFDR